jgi:hypothetical protein
VSVLVVAIVVTVAVVLASGGVVVLIARFSLAIIMLNIILVRTVASAITTFIVRRVGILAVVSLAIGIIRIIVFASLVTHEISV